MSTRAYIIMQTKEGKYRGVYNHFDGYLSGIGMTLKNYYSNYEKVEQLIELGDLSIVGEKIEPAPVVRQYGFDWRYNEEFEKLPDVEQTKLANEEPCHTVAYARDRGEELYYAKWDTLKDIHQNFKETSMIEYVYLFRNDQWYYYCPYDEYATFELLTDEAIAEDDFS